MSILTKFLFEIPLEEIDCMGRLTPFLLCFETGILGAIYAKKGDSAELEKMTQLYMSPAEYSSEHWLIFGYHYYVLKKYDKASYFAHKSCYLNPRNVEAGLLKGNPFVNVTPFLLNQFISWK